MLVRNVIPLMVGQKVAIYDGEDRLEWRGLWIDLSEHEELLDLIVVRIDFDRMRGEFVIVTDGSPDEIELLLSECMRHADMLGVIDYLAIMHAARRVASLAEIAVSRIMGRWWR